MPVSVVPSKNEELQRLLCELVRKNDELRLEVRRLTELFTVTEVAVLLDERGYWSDEGSRNVVFDFAWEHPDWFRAGILTAVGGEYIRLSEGGLVFTWAGKELVLEQFLGGE